MNKLLLVEDDAWLAELQVSALEKAGFKVKLAAHAPSAIQAVDQFKPDAIILDLLLTGSTGFALLHELQSYSDTRLIPVVLCTSAGENLTADSLQPYGVRKIIDKTVMMPDDLVAAVRSLLT